MESSDNDIDEIQQDWQAIFNIDVGDIRALECKEVDSHLIEMDKVVHVDEVPMQSSGNDIVEIRQPISNIDVGDVLPDIRALECNEADSHLIEMDKVVHVDEVPMQLSGIDIDEIRQPISNIDVDDEMLDNRALESPDGEICGVAREEDEENIPAGWECPSCTYVNDEWRPGCEMCTTACPAEGASHGFLFYELLTLQNGCSIARSYNKFKCPVCFDDVTTGEGVVLNNCLHSFCRECLVETVLLSDQSDVQCPYANKTYSCVSNLQDCEIRALLSDVQYKKYLDRSLIEAEKRCTENKFHCKSRDCDYWCTYENVTAFTCPVCGATNCIKCKVIHEGQTCVEYNASDMDKQESLMLNELIKNSDVMKCPKCKILITKMQGCDYLVCTGCQLPICWITRGPRWGPLGQGDNTGGCRCQLNGRRCHPNCLNCH